MANSWDEFFAAPVKASKKLHVAPADVKRGAQIDARRREAERLVAEQNKTTPTGLPYGITPRPSGVPSDAPSLYAGELAKSAPPELISNALLAGNLGGLSAAFGALAPLRAGLAVGAGADAVLGAKAGEGDIPAVLSGAGMLGRRALPVALATGAAYAADAEASPVQKMLQMFYHGSNKPLERGVIRGALDVSPQRRVGQYFADKRTNDLGGVPRVHSILADPFAGEKHGLALPFDRLDDSTPNFTQARRLSEKDRPIQLVTDNGVEEFAGGGLVKSGLRMMFPNLGAPLHVVKPKGGNWLNNSVEDALSGLQKPIRGSSDAVWAALPEDIRAKYQNASGPHQLVQQNYPKEWASAKESLQGPIDNWIEGPLTKYVKTRMASPEDEVRRLADQGVLHFDPAAMPRYMDDVWGRRELTGNPATMGTAPLAQKWEAYADQMVRPRRMGDKWRASRTGEATTRDIVAGDSGGEWATNAADDAMVYQLQRPGTSSAAQVTAELGFDHLVDELSNALDPNSGLPRHLQLTPEAVKNLSMEKAVRRVADINAWRAAQKIEANQKIAGGPGQELVREYAHSPEKPNPKGLRWVELKKQPGEALSDAQLAKAMEERGMYPDEIEAALKDPKQRAQIEEQAFSDTGALADQLRYEGDTMGHCVGGYCDDVANGRSRIFSLRDAKGEPHVTVEVEPKWNNKMGDESATELSITQIKGKQNRKPKDEYLPFVQDFVKNPPHGAPWGDVGDLENSGLFRVQPGQKWPGFSEDIPAGYWSVEDAEKQAVEKGMDPDVLQNWLQKLRNPHPGYASGGSVSDVARGWDVLTDPLGSPEENKLSWDIFSGHNSPEQLEALA